MADELDELLKGDLAALREASAVEPGSMDETLRAVEARRERTKSEGGWHMMLRQVKARPRWTVAAISIAIVAALLIVPVPYQRPSGHEVTMRLGGMDRRRGAAVAQQVGRALAAEGVRLEPDADGVVLRAQLPQRSRAAVERRVEAVTRALRARGMAVAQVGVAARSVGVSGSVYAMARDQVAALRIDVDGKTAAEIEADLRAQLDAILSDAHVHVEQQGGVTSISISEASKVEGDDDDHDEQGPELVLPPGAHVERVEVRADGGDLASAAAAVRQKLAEKGIDAEVVVEDGHIVVHAKAPPKQP